ncbi:MAG TPA: acyl-ACP thioesterase domain-containing protein [Solirubrobacteraceae bacterium]
MLKQAPLSELEPAPRTGRVFTQTRRPGLGDCAPSGRMRLDALANWLQDVAYADVEDAGVADGVVWVVRRARIRVRRFPRFGESFVMSTFATGLGRMWAERGTTIARQGAEAVDVDAAFLWVHLDPLGRHPTALTAEEIAKYGEAAAGRRVSARLRHPPPQPAERSFTWTFRATECDLAGHINNTAYWHPLEEELLRERDPDAIDVEIEYRTPAQPGEKTVLCDGHWRWFIGDEGETLASIVMA